MCNLNKEVNKAAVTKKKEGRKDAFKSGESELKCEGRNACDTASPKRMHGGFSPKPLTRFPLVPFFNLT